MSGYIANNSDHSISMTNKGMERFFGKIRCNKRKRTSISDAGNILSPCAEKIAPLQNLGERKYIQTVLGTQSSETVACAFAEYRKPFKRKGKAVKETNRLVEEGRRMIMNKSPSRNPYTDELFERAKGLRIGGSG